MNAWQSVKTICGGVSAYSKRMNVKRSTASDWFRKPGMQIPVEHLALTELITGICLEDLAPFPFQEARNAIMRQWQRKK